MKQIKHFLSLAASVMLAVAMSMSFSSCSDDSDDFTDPPQPAYDIPVLVKNLPGTEVWEIPVDYSDDYNWAVLPTSTDKPFFLAGHSQGAAVVEALLAGYFKQHPEYYSRMIAAYPIGYAVTTDYLEKNPHLKFAEGADDTGVIVSYNTEGAENKSQYNVVVAPSGSLSINPINWKRDATPATFAENKGSLLVTDYVSFYDEIQEKGVDAAIAAHSTDGLADATLDTERGVLVTNADAAFCHEATSVFGTASYHSFDWLFFAANLKENVAVRIEAYESMR